MLKKSAWTTHFKDKYSELHPMLWNKQHLKWMTAYSTFCCSNRSYDVNAFSSYLLQMCSPFCLCEFTMTLPSTLTLKVSLWKWITMGGCCLLFCMAKVYSISSHTMEMSTGLHSQGMARVLHHGCPEGWSWSAC